MANPIFYDLLVLLDPEAPEERRGALIEQIKGQIDAGDASLKGDADWGMRRLAFEIDHRREAQYHLFQFQAVPDVLNALDRMLSIDDAVLRHRIIKLPDEPPETTPRPADDSARRSADGARDGEDGARRRPEDGEEPQAEPAAATPPAAEEPAVDEPAAEEPSAEPAAEEPRGEAAGDTPASI
jgi:small subunit ribosomal protein S6